MVLRIIGDDEHRQVGVALMVVTDLLRRFALWRCRFLGWHPSRYRQHTGFDGASLHERCLRCGIEGMVDSQGNLF